MSAQSVTVEGAAVLVGVSSRTVRRWVADGLLVALPGQRGRAKLYLVREVYEAERAARRKVLDGHAQRVSQ